MCLIVKSNVESSQGVLLPTIEKGLVFTLRGKTFRVRQVIAESNRVYLQPKLRDGSWADWDQGGDLHALQVALTDK